MQAAERAEKVKQQRSQIQTITKLLEADSAKKE
jgi:hypothetical protein